MRYAKIMKNDIVDCEEGICVSFWTQGCPHKCKGCHNPQTWDINGGIEKPREEIINEIVDAISSHGINRSFSILGGEPLSDFNRENVAEIIKSVREKYPNIKIYCWTGYTYEKLVKLNNSYINYILENINVLIDGPFILEQKDITLKLQGSNNQRIIKKGE